MQAKSCLITVQQNGQFMRAVNDGQTVRNLLRVLVLQVQAVAAYNAHIFGTSGIAYPSVWLRATSEKNDGVHWSGSQTDEANARQFTAYSK